MKLIHFYTLMAAALFTSCQSKKEHNGAISDNVIPVEVITIRKEIIYPLFHVSGEFSTEDETNLSFMNGGIIQSISVKEGDAVKKGQILATLDMTAIEAHLSQAEITLSKAERDYSRASELYRDSVATLEQMQNARTALDIARQQVEIAGFNKNAAVIHATRSGYVLQRFVEEGQTVGSGTPILRINGAAGGNWVMKTGVSDRQWAAIRDGDSATITIDAYPERQFIGYVVNKSKGVDPASDLFTVTIGLENTTNADIATGLFGQAVIKGSVEKIVWRLPFSALLDSDRSTGYVFVVSDSQTAQKIPVTIEGIESNKVLISSGLENYDQIIATGNAYLTDGSRVEIVR